MLSGLWGLSVSPLACGLEHNRLQLGNRTSWHKLQREWVLQGKWGMLWVGRMAIL